MLRHVDGFPNVRRNVGPEPSPDKGGESRGQRARRPGHLPDDRVGPFGRRDEGFPVALGKPLDEGVDFFPEISRDPPFEGADLDPGEKIRLDPDRRSVLLRSGEEAVLNPDFPPAQA